MYTCEGLRGLGGAAGNLGYIWGGAEVDDHGGRVCPATAQLYDISNGIRQIIGSF